MPKYDAFGREIGEDPLAGWRAEGATASEAAPSEPIEAPRPEPVEAPRREPVAAPPRPEPAAPPVIRVPMPRPRGRRPRVVSRLILLIVVIAVGANLASRAGEEIDGLIPEDGPGAAVDGPAPVGLQPRSLLRPAELRGALDALRERGLGRVQTLRLDPARIDATMVSRRGVMNVAQVTHEGAFRRFSSSPGNGHLDTIAWARLDPSAPAALARRAAARLRRPVTRINYLVATTFDGRVTWNAYFKGGQIFQGDARGRLVRRIS